MEKETKDSHTIVYFKEEEKRTDDDEMMEEERFGGSIEHRRNGQRMKEGGKKIDVPSAAAIELSPLHYSRSADEEGGLKRSLSRTMDKGQANRIYDRAFPHFQSSGQAKIRRRNGLTWGFKIWYDWYHSVANLPTRWATAIACILYVTVNAAFALIWWGMSTDGDPCNIGATTYGEAFYFSLITLSTIGYGNQDLYFNGCSGPTIVITLETLVGLLLDAGIFALLILKYSRGRPRGFSVCFSRYAIVRFIDGKPYFSFRVVERRKHQLVEAHVRCYVIRHDRDPESGLVTYFQQFTMRLQKPDDELGGMLLLVLPTEVVHRIDPWSPLYVPRIGGRGSTSINSYRFPEPLQRAADADAGGRDQFECPTCGETYIAEENFRRHVRYCRNDDVVSGHDDATSCAVCGESYPSRQHLQRHVRYCCNEDSDASDSQLTHRKLGGKRISSTRVPVHPVSHIELTDATIQTTRVSSNEQSAESERMRKFFVESNVEIVAIVEGICPITSCTLQSRHSYHARSGDIVFNHCFEPCTSISSDGGCIIDYDAFQGVAALKGGNRAPPPCSH